jgi:hypothetical protein
MLQTPRYKFNATVPLITSGIKSDPFKIRPFKEKGTYTYKNNPDAILGAIGHGKINIGFPSIKTKPGKKGKKRLLP